MEVRFDGDNVLFVITAGGGTGSIRIMNAARDATRQLGEVHFADGTVMTWGEVTSTRVVRGTGGNDVLRTFSLPGETVTVFAVRAQNTIHGGQGQDIFVLGSGNDQVFARYDVEGGGHKIFVWGEGGHDVIHYFNPNRVEGDGLSILRFGPGIAPQNVVARYSGDNVTLTIAGVSRAGSIRFVNARADIRRQMDEIRFADGTVWKWNEVPRQ